MVEDLRKRVSALEEEADLKERQAAAECAQWQEHRAALSARLEEERAARQAESERVRLVTEEGDAKRRALVARHNQTLAAQQRDVNGLLAEVQRLKQSLHQQRRSELTAL